AECKCLLTHKGDPYIGCFERTSYNGPEIPIHDFKACSHDDDCDKYLNCREQKCIPICMGEYLRCGPNTYCHYDFHRRSAECKCAFTYKGDPYTGCFEATLLGFNPVPEFIQQLSYFI
ncbi:hypothetical protein PV326_012018, partial [Microctonus aethiopoides]